MVTVASDTMDSFFYFILFLLLFITNCRLFNPQSNVYWLKEGKLDLITIKQILIYYISKYSNTLIHRAFFFCNNINLPSYTTGKICKLN